MVMLQPYLGNLEGDNGCACCQCIALRHDCVIGGIHDGPKSHARRVMLLTCVVSLKVRSYVQVE
jgi:hypothetical protein